MGITGQEPPRGGDRVRGPAVRDRPESPMMAAARKARLEISFEEFLRMIYPRAKAWNNVEWLEWYEGWLKNMPEDNREEYIERSKAEYEERLGETIGENLDRSLCEMIDRNTDERINERIDRNTDERIKRNVEDIVNHQIMVGNFEAFRREYMGMAANRSC